MTGPTHAPTKDVGRSIPGGGIWDPGRRLLTTGLVLVITLVAFESLAITTVMTAVAKDLGGLDRYGWTFSSFFIGNLVGFVNAGLLADRHGPARPFAIGAALFALGLAIGGLAPSMEVLIAGRAIQGFGGAAVPTAAYVAIGRVYPEAVRPRMFAILSTAWIVPGIVGPGLAGVIAQVATWRLVFLGLIPFVIVGGLIVAASLRPLGPLPEGAASAAADGRRRLGAAILVAAGATLLLAASTIGDPLAGLALVAAGLAVGLPALRRLLPAGTLVARRGLPAVILARGLSTFAFFGAEAFVPLTLVTVRGLSVAESGLLLTAATTTWTVGAWGQAHGMERIGGPRLIAIGFGCVTVGLAGVALVLEPTVPLVVGVVAWALGGLGMGFLYSAITHLVLIEAPPDEQGSVSASLNLSDVLGSALGTGAGGATIAYAALAGLAPEVGLAAAFAVTVLVGAVGVVVSGRLVPPQRIGSEAAASA